MVKIVSDHPQVTALRLFKIILKSSWQGANQIIRLFDRLMQ